MPEPERVQFVRELLKAVGLEGKKVTRFDLHMEPGEAILVDAEFIVLDDVGSLKTRFKKYKIDVVSVEEEGEVVES